MPKTETILSDNLFPVVGIGASAGGLDAFRKFLHAIPADSGMAYVLVQHLDPKHESLLPELLQKVTVVPVIEISDDIEVQPDHIYVLPSNRMLVANDGILELTVRPEHQKNRPHLPIDLFFTSLAEVHQAHAIGIVLSGTASDGTIGLRAIKDYGGITFAQEEATAAYSSMPNSAIQAGVVDFILSPEEMPQKILELTQRMGRDTSDAPNLDRQEETVFKQILALLRDRKGTDFTYYKQTTISRRILRRMALNKTSDLPAYLDYLSSSTLEQDILYQDMLIPVTNFFRDPQSFDQLCETVFPHILKNKPPGEPIRIWVAGCSTGQEAYSMAICFQEFLRDSTEKVQIFATDLSEPAIAKARTGIYSKTEVDSVDYERLQSFFTQSRGNYQVNKSIREMCVFAVHNFLKDPPFGKMDLISCRNVLIYMQPYLQKKALTTFHYALNPRGSLFLGKTETTNSVSDLFATHGKNDKLFSRKDVPGKFMHVASQRSEQNLSKTGESDLSEPVRTDFLKIADNLVLQKYAPPGVIVNEALDIVHFRGNTSPYFEQLTGKPNHNLLKLSKRGLAFELRNLLHKSKKQKIAVSKENIFIELNGTSSHVSLEVIPLPNTADIYYLILFHDQLRMPEQSATARKMQKIFFKNRTDDKDLRIEQLEQELAQTHEDMRSITEDQEAVNEELQSDNEELLSNSEELQSLNEELETSKEELQSTNEELTVVNQEIIGLNELLTEARDYAEGIVATIREPLLILDKDLRVKTANSSYYKTFQVDAADTEGKLIYEVDNQQWDIPALRRLLENILPEQSSFQDFEITHTFSTLGKKVMLLNASELQKEGSSEKLILLAIEDITLQKQSEEIQNQLRKKFEFIADAMPQKVWTADAAGRMDYFNKTWLDYTGLPFEELKDTGWEKVIHPDDAEKNRLQWKHAVETGEDFELEDRFRNKAGAYKWHLSRGLSYKDDTGRISMWVGTNTEIQDHVLRKEGLEKAVAERTYELQHAIETLGENNNELERMNKELESFTYISSHDLQEPLRKIQTFASLLLQAGAYDIPETARDYLGRMQSAAWRMQQLIMDLLSFSRINTADRIFRHTALDVLIQEVKAELEEVIRDKNAVVTSNDPGYVNVIPFQLRQLLYNLISNALKFSKPEIPPHIVISVKMEPGSFLLSSNPDLPADRISPARTYCHIAVSDNGIGFEPHFRKRIFDVFQKLHPQEAFLGTGIGLAIVKRIVENHHGFITANSELGVGTTFDIYIPDLKSDAAKKL